ncbi:MAG: S-adenosylmethionine:tRNA ribosyltransferase-isomerase, partial [Candidatus Omnitrophica bacterium]|nr:S-adenosylmethionine:tRNA ribosyltransferase-isomerase [Candidatus Omnitrophota bacterium]
MSLSYTLPRELIAQTPKEKREEARLLVLSRSTGRIRDSIFKEIVNLLGDRHLIVLNNTKVFPARLIASSDSGGKVEVLLVRERA